MKPSLHLVGVGMGVDHFSFTPHTPPLRLFSSQKKKKMFKLSFLRICCTGVVTLFCARLWIRTLLVRCSLEIFEYERSHLVHVSADQKEDVTEYIRKGQSRGSRKLASWLLNTVPAYFFLRIVEPLSFTIFFPLLGRYSYSQRWENKGSRAKRKADGHYHQKTLSRVTPL